MLTLIQVETGLDSKLRTPALWRKEAILLLAELKYLCLGNLLNQIARWMWSAFQTILSSQSSAGTGLS